MELTTSLLLVTVVMVALFVLISARHSVGIRRLEQALEYEKKARRELDERVTDQRYQLHRLGRELGYAYEERTVSHWTKEET